MPSLFSGINVALRAMLAQQQVVEVIEHNVANVNTPGYRRQSAILSTGIPTTMAGFHNIGDAGQMGTGVQVERIQRYTLEYFDDRYRNEVAQSKHWDIQSDVLKQVQSSLTELGDDGLVAKLDTFWGSWQTLSGDASNTNLRADVLAEGKILADAFKSRSEKLLSLRTDQNLAIRSRVEEVNTVASQVARLNGQISQVMSLNDQPNDLMDQRDLLLDRLSELTGAVSHLQENGEVMVSINGHALVSGQTTSELKITGEPLSATVLWADGQSFSADKGELAGLLDVRDRIIPEQQKGLDTLAANLINAVNDVHNPVDPVTGMRTSHLFFFTPPATETVAFSGNLPANTSIDPAYDPANPVAGTYVDTNLCVNDSAGNVSNLQVRFTRVPANSGASATWAWQVIGPGGAAGNGTLDIAGSGQVSANTTATPVSIPMGGGAALRPSIDLSGITMSGNTNNLSTAAQTAPADGAAYTIQVSADMEDTTKILGKTAGEPGNGSIASAMAGLKTQGLAGLGGKTINSFYTDQAADLGLEVQKASNYSKDHDTLAKSLSDQRDSLTGVSMDEEAANLVKAQRAFEAASRLVSVMDDMLDKVINGMGMVGR